MKSKSPNLKSGGQQVAHAIRLNMGNKAQVKICHMDKRHEYRVSAGFGIGLSLLGIPLPYVWHEIPTLISYPMILMGVALLLWGSWPPLKEWFISLNTTHPNSLQITKEYWVKINKAVAYVAECICDTNEGQCYPSTLTALRQKAADGSLRIRGCKQLNIKNEIRFSDIHTDIPKAYWAISKNGPMATSPAYLRSTHTNPEAAYSWGPNGVYENNGYCDLVVDWNEILKLWQPNAQVAKC